MTPVNYKIRSIRSLTPTLTAVETTACSGNRLPKPTGSSAGRKEEVGKVKGEQERAEEEEDEG